MVVPVSLVPGVPVPVVHVVHVSVVWHRHVPASFAVLVVVPVVDLVAGRLAFVEVALVLTVQVTVVDVVDMFLVWNGDMPTVRSMPVLVRLVLPVQLFCCHCSSSAGTWYARER